MGCLLNEVAVQLDGNIARIRKPVILVVDDEPSIRRFIASALQLNYETLLARDGLEAMKFYLSYADSIDCVITDLVMPRVTGDRFLAWLRQRNSSVPVILMTGGGGPNLDRALKHPQVALLRKPFTLAQLDEALRNV